VESTCAKSPKYLVMKGEEGEGGGGCERIFVAPRIVLRVREACGARGCGRFGEGYGCIRLDVGFCSGGWSESEERDRMTLLGGDEMGGDGRGWVEMER
jgi:hypothetical protein